MKYLGIDFGTKRIGLAVSDESGMIVRPYSIVKNDKQALLNIISVIQKEGIGSLVVGESRNESGDNNDLQKDINEFIGVLTLETFLPIERISEAFSSYEAHGRQGKESKNARKEKMGKTENLDARAACVILERYLSKKK